MAREFYVSMRAAGFNVKALVTLGTPNQGAAVAERTRADVYPIIDRVKFNIDRAMQYKHPTVYGLIGLIDPSAQGDIDGIPSHIAHVDTVVEDYMSQLEDSEAGSKIGIEGAFIQSINSRSSTNASQHPPFFLATSGAEKDKSVVRMSGGVLASRGDVENEDQLGEKTMVDRVAELRKYFDANVSAYQVEEDYNHIRTYWFWKGDDYVKRARAARDRAKQRKGYWKAALGEIDNLETSWSQVIASYEVKFEYVTYYEWVPGTGDDCAGPIQKSRPTSLSEFEALGALEPTCEGEWIQVTERVRINIPDKHDGIVNVKSTRWAANHSNEDFWNQHNSDVEMNQNNVDVGGYNHFELRNAKRKYTLPGGFSKGDPNPPMQRVKEWIRDNKTQGNF